MVQFQSPSESNHPYRLPASMPEYLEEPAPRPSLKRRLARNNLFKVVVGVLVVVTVYWLLMKLGVWVGTFLIGYGPTSWGDRYIGGPLIGGIALCMPILAFIAVNICRDIGDAVVKRWMK